MRILISCLSKSWGGMEMFAIDSARQLHKKNFDVYFFGLDGTKISEHLDFLPEEKKLCVKSNSYFNFKNIIQLGKFIKTNKIDLVHTQYSKDLWTIVPALYLIRRKIPLILTKQLGSFVIKKDFLHRWIYNRVDKAIAISTVIKNNLIETTPLLEEKIEIIHNAIDLGKFNQTNFNRSKIRKELSIDESTFVFTNISRLSPGKGQDVILKAISLIKEKLTDTKFLFVGSAQEDEKFYEEELKKYVKEKLLDDYAVFLGFRSDAPAILAMSDAFIFPSYAEAFGISLVEAMAMGLPSIVCKADGVLDIIIENKTSLVFERNNIEKLAEEILKLRYDENLRNTLSEASLRRAREFDFSIYNEKIIRLYYSLLKNQIT